MQRDIDEIAKELSGGLSLDDLRRLQSREPNAVEVGLPEPTPEQRAKMEAYTAIVRGERIPANYASAVRILLREMEYEKARIKMADILQARANEISILEKRAPDNLFRWVFSDAEKQTLKNLLLYFINDRSCAYDVCKGLFVYGAPGTGKTEAMRCFHQFALACYLEKRFEWTSMSATYVTAKTDKEFDPIAQNVTMNRLFDEFGRYSGPVLRFGDPLDINEAIVEQRYERWKRYGQFSFFIANVTPNELPELVSPMLLDRIREMCNTVYFPGKSKRT